MIQYERRVLPNKLTVLVQEDNSSPLVAINILYKVGSRNEHPERTGFAHLFEHLMFSGSKHVPDFDKPIQLAGGENNAFTNNDTTNFYEILPSENIETALWLESDRMKYLKCTEKTFKVQQKVVVEEFKETTLNQPYGDVWHTISAASFKKHPYNWPTIGKTPEHIENALLSEVKDFYNRYYHPGNAIISIAGNIKAEKAFDLVNKWFGDIDNKGETMNGWESEDKQNDPVKITRKAEIPLRSLYLSFHMHDRLHPNFYVCDVISDLLSGGRSSRFYQRLYKEKEMFSYSDAYITGTVDPGLFIIEGKPNEKISVDAAYEAIWQELEELKEGRFSDQELEKVKNKIESALVYSEVNILNKAINIAYFEMLGDVSLINKQSAFYQNVSNEDVIRVSNELFKPSNSTEITYLPNK